MAPKVLDLRGSPAWRVTPSVWMFWCEAAAVSLQRFHAPPQVYFTSFFPKSDHIDVLTWEAVSEVAKLSHGNDNVAVENGAYAVAGLILHAVDGWTVVARPQHATGADVLISHPEWGLFKLEVGGKGAGLDLADLRELQGRLRKKVKQVRKGGLDKPALAVVVGFECRRALVSEVQR